MDEERSFDFLKQKYQLAPKREDRKKEKRHLRFFVYILFAIACTGLFFSYRAQSSSQGEFNGSFSLFNPFTKALESIGIGDNNDRINILLLGIGGAGHEGPELTDTIMVASIKPSTKEVAMLSVPRDLFVQVPNIGGRKINNVNALAEAEKKGSGPKVTSEVIGSILNQKIDYYVKIDFDSFEYLIDTIEGVDIHVDNAFSDATYPTLEKGVQTVVFEQGWQHMNGTTALQYARSRHGTNGEGSDFARAVRQQKVITAVKDDLLSSATLLNPGRMNQLAQLALKHVTTNMNVVDIIRLSKITPDISSNNIKHFVLDDAPKGPLYSSTLNGAYVLLPKKADWSDLRYLSEHIFDEQATLVTAPKSLNAPTQETRISIQNGTLIGGLASESAEVLQNSGFTVVDVGNAPVRTITKTTIFDLTEGKKPIELDILRSYFSADIVETEKGWLRTPQTLPDELTTDIATYIDTNNEKVDFFIVLGQDAQQLVLR